MKHNLNEDWYLTYDESKLLKNKSFPYKLAMAVQLKQYQSNGSFPKTTSEISTGLLSHLSHQLDTNGSILKGYDWTSRTARNHKEEILKFLGIEKTNGLHRKELTDFLVSDILPFGNTKTEIWEICLKWFLGQKLMVPTEKVLSRIISSALAKFESGLFNHVVSFVERGTAEMFDRCLDMDPGEKGSFMWLRSDPGRIEVATVQHDWTNWLSSRPVHYRSIISGIYIRKSGKGSTKG